MTQRYDVYGVGNALVDIEVETTPDQLSDLGVDKGVMTLVEAERQQFLLGALSGVHHRRTGGGSAANTITALAQLGSRCYYACRVADDDAGHFFAEDMKKLGIATNAHDDKGNGSPTGTCLVMVTPDADRTMNTSLGISATLTADQLVEDELAASAFLYIEGYLVSTPNSLDTAQQARKLAAKHGVKTAFTFSDPAMVRFCRDGLDQVLGDGVDVLLCNEEEALGFTGKGSVEEAGDMLRERAGILGITLGPKGARVWDGDTWIDIAPHQVTAVDSNGAGDLFAGAFLYGVTQGLGCQMAGELASLGSAELVTRFGARMERDALLDVKTRILG
jgi:sugar/nucleoside kinase (ribokinase family)